MRKTSILVATVLLISALLSLPVAQGLKPGVDFSGIHFNLNVHGVPVGVSKPVPDDSGIGRHSIFVPLADYNLSIAVNGNEWQVPDCDATDDGNVSIILPRNVAVAWDVNGTPTQYKTAKSYMVYVVALGKPLRDSNVVIDPKAIFIDASSNKTYILREAITVSGHRNGKLAGPGGGQPNWVNATDIFLVDIQEMINGTLVTIPDQWVFNVTSLQDYWWSVTNSGVRLMQVRFYPVF